MVEAVREPFERMYVELMRTFKLGDPLDEKNQVSTRTISDLRDDLHQQVRQSIEKGCSRLLGGEVPEGPGGYLISPTVLSGVEAGDAGL